MEGHQTVWVEAETPFNNQLAEEFLDLRSAHSLWVLLIMENDEALYPVEIGLLG